MNAKESLVFTNDKCTGCNRCISVCTVPEANYVTVEDGKNKIHIDGDKCINCGKCMVECPHQARDYLDDTELFLQRLGQGGDISVIVAPAVRTNVPEYQRLLGLLRKLGARAVYDTSFGADICSWGYIRYMQKNRVSGLISQPCPAIVNYIEKHKASLLPSLAPIHSPVMCTAIYMRKYRKLGGEFAFISPCIAKRDEFHDPNNGDMIQYNVTFKKLLEVLEHRGHDYRSAPADSYDNDRHGLGALYPMPGGLKANVHKVLPDAWVYQVEGQPEVRSFLHHYATLSSKKEKPFLVDILNCAKGCNHGTGAVCAEEDDLRVIRVMYEAQRELVGSDKHGFIRKNDIQNKIMADFDKELDLQDFIRRYTDKTVRPIRITSQQVEDAYLQLYKMDAESRRIDCCSCGYETCEEMATAIAKKLNHPGNCVEYHKRVVEGRQEEIQAMLEQRVQATRELNDSVERIFQALSETSQKCDDATRQTGQINEEILAVQDIAHQLAEMMDALQQKIDQYINIGAHIVSLSTQTKLLAMNASVEAARAKEFGRGFSVVAEQMKLLSENSERSAKEILFSNEAVIPMLEKVRKFSQSIDTRTETISQSTQSILQAMQDISDSEQAITDTASILIADQVMAD